MRKRPAAVMVGMFVMITGTYMAWCALPCVRPMLVYDKDVPDEARQAINEWRRTSKYLQPSPPGYFARSLATPWRMKFHRLEVKMDAIGRAQVRDLTSNGIFFEPDASGKWKGTIYGCFGSHPAN